MLSAFNVLYAGLAGFDAFFQTMKFFFGQLMHRVGGCLSHGQKIREFEDIYVLRRLFLKTSACQPGIGLFIIRGLADYFLADGKSRCCGAGLPVR